LGLTFDSWSSLDNAGVLHLIHSPTAYSVLGKLGNLPNWAKAFTPRVLGFGIAEGDSTGRARHRDQGKR